MVGLWRETEREREREREYCSLNIKRETACFNVSSEIIKKIYYF